MAERRGFPDDLTTEAALEAGLRDLADAIAYPAASAALVAIVGARLRDTRPGAGRVWLPGDRSRRVRVAFLLAAALVVLLAAVVAAAVIGLPGIRIVFQERPMSSPSATVVASPAPVSPSPAGPTALGGSLFLGDPIQPAGLDVAAGRHVLRPTRLPAPATAWIDRGPALPVVSLVWPASPTLPDTAANGSTTPTGIGAILTEIPATIEEPYLGKVIGTGGTVERVSVGGQPGFWISGAPHELVLVDRNGQGISSTTRLAGSSLLWMHDGQTLRLETGLDRARAIALGTSVR